MKLFDPVKFQHDLHNSILLAVETLKMPLRFFTKNISLCSTLNPPSNFPLKKSMNWNKNPGLPKAYWFLFVSNLNFINSSKILKKKEFYNKFKTYRDIINSLLRKSKRQFWKKYFAEHSSNSKKLGLQPTTYSVEVKRTKVLTYF